MNSYGSAAIRIGASMAGLLATERRRNCKFEHLGSRVHLGVGFRPSHPRALRQRFRGLWT